MQHLEDLSLVDLRLVAKKWGIKGVTAYRKQELLEFLKDEQKKRGGDSAEIKEEPAPEVTEEPADSLKEEISASEKEYKGRQMPEKNDLNNSRPSAERIQKRWSNGERAVTAPAERGPGKEDEKRNAYNKRCPAIAKNSSNRGASIREKRLSEKQKRHFQSVRKDTARDRRIRQRWSSLIAARLGMAFWKYCQRDMGLSAVTIICRVRRMCTFHRP